MSQFLVPMPPVPPPPPRPKARGVVVRPKPVKPQPVRAGGRFVPPPAPPPRPQARGVVVMAVPSAGAGRSSLKSKQKSASTLMPRGQLVKKPKPSPASWRPEVKKEGYVLAPSSTSAPKPEPLPDMPAAQLVVNEKNPAEADLEVEVTGEEVSAEQMAKAAEVSADQVAKAADAAVGTSGGGMTKYLVGGAVLIGLYYWMSKK